MQTPTTPEGERMYDHLDPVAAALAAWTVTGPRPDWHESAKDRVRAAMPLLGRALDRAAGEDPDGFPREWMANPPTTLGPLNDVAKCPECGRQTRSYSRGCSSCGYGQDRPEIEP